MPRLRKRSRPGWLSGARSRPAIRIGFLSGFAFGCLAMLLWSQTKTAADDASSRVASIGATAASIRTEP